jgi:membrane dipeptidase
MRTGSSFCISLFVLSAIPFISFRLTATSPESEEHLQRAREILTAVPLIDGHNDIPWRYRSRVNFDLDRLDFSDDLSGVVPPIHTDIPRLRHGLVGGQFWAVYVPETFPGADATGVAEELIEFIYRFTDRYSDTFGMAFTADDVDRIFTGGKIASLIGLEGGHAINNSLAVLRELYEAGARYMTLTTMANTDWADSATDEPRNNGLSPFGKEVVREMNRLGMLVDLSHVSVAGMHDAIDVSEAPVIFSHSSAYSVTRNVRNVPDDVLRRIPDNGGIVMVTFVPSFVSEEVRTYVNREERLRKELGEEYSADEESVNKSISEWRKHNPPPSASLADVADHIDHVRNLIGVDYIGIGSDFDGIRTVPAGLEDVSRFPLLFAELLRRGYSEDDLKKIAGLNILRVMREAEHIAARLQNERHPSEAVFEALDRDE